MSSAASMGPWSLPELLVASRDPAFAWTSLRPGVDEHRLYGSHDGVQPTVSVLRYQPGAHVPAHRHQGYEYIHVLAGSQRDNRGTYSAGALVVNAPGSAHEVVSDGGCTVLVIWERPIAFLEPDRGAGG